MSRLQIPLLLLCISLFAHSAFTRQPVVEASDTTIVTEFVKALNAADEAPIRTFFLTRAQPQELKRVPVDVRLERYREMKNNLISITLQRILAVTREQATAVMRDACGKSLLFAFNVALTPPNGLVSLSIRMSSDRGQLESQSSPARTDDELAALGDKVVDSLARADEFSGLNDLRHR
jgi:hypothetical protein